MPRIFFVHAALFLVACLYASNYVLAKFATPQYVMPFGLVLIRAGGASLLFWFFHSLTIREKIKHRRDYLRFMYCGLFGVTINQLFFFKGISLTSPINASIIITSTPIVVLLASSLLLKERITWLKIVGIALGMGGAVGVIMLSSKSATVSGNPWGDFFVFVNALSYGFYLVLVKPLMKEYKALTVVKWVFTFGFVGIIPFGVGELMSTSWEVIPLYVYWIVLYIIVGVTFGVYLLNAWALSHVNATVVSVYIYLQPILTSMIAVAFRQDELRFEKVLFAMLIFLGVYLVNKKTKTVQAKILT